jgi:3-phosphoshikimate 1-carboxyvinyltransferase
VTGSDVYCVEPIAGPLDATVDVPGSKSLTNRALVLAALADGTSTIEGVLAADDTDAMLSALEALLIRTEVDRARNRVVVHGARGVMRAEEATIDCRRSGTTARFLLPVAAAFAGRYRITGSDQLAARPMGELVSALRELGAQVVEAGAPGRLPLVVGGPAKGGRVTIRGDVTSQFVSGLMMAAPLFDDGLTIECSTELVSRPYVEMTAQTMARFGVVADVDDRTIVVPSARYVATDYAVEPDASSASYFFAAAALVGGSVRVRGLTRSSAQGDLAFVHVLEAMGASVRWHEDSVEVIGTGELRGVDVDMHDMPDMALTVAALAPFAASPTTVTNVEVIRGHETDRIAAIVNELGKLGVVVDERRDGFTVHPATALSGAALQTYDDHRVAMAFALIGLRSRGVCIADPGCVAKTFPGFFEVLGRLQAS